MLTCVLAYLLFIAIVKHSMSFTSWCQCKKLHFVTSLKKADKSITSKSCYKYQLNACTQVAIRVFKAKYEILQLYTNSHLFFYCKNEWPFGYNCKVSQSPEGDLRNFAKFTEKHLCQILSFKKIAWLSQQLYLKRRLWHRCFPVNFAKFLRIYFLTEHLRWLDMDLADSIN